MKKFLVSLVLALSLVFAPVSSYAAATKSPVAPKGFVKKAENATFALYASSVSANVSNAFLCTVTAVQKVKGGYLMIGAGHCTSANPDLPTDLTYAVSSQMAQSLSDLSPIFLIKSEMTEPLDYAIYFYPTDNKIPTIALGDERKAQVGDNTIDINFSLGIVKEFSPGIVVSMTIPDGANYVDGTQGFFEVQEFDSHGASGSSVIDMHGKKIIGLVIAGIDGATIPSFVEPISTVEAAIKGYKLPNVTAQDVANAQKTIVSSELFRPSNEMTVAPWQRGHNHPTPARPNPPARQPIRGDRHPDQSGRDHHARVDQHRDTRVINGHTDIRYNGCWFSIYGNGVWPYWAFQDEVYFVEIDGVWFAYDYTTPANGGVVVIIAE